MAELLDNYEVVDDRDTLEPQTVHNLPEREFSVNVGNETFLIRNSDFNIDEENLTEEACMQGQRMVYYGDILAKAKAEHASAESARKAYYSQMYVTVRQQMRDPTSKLYMQIKEKMTEGYIENWIGCDVGYRQLLAVEGQAQRIMFRAQAWWSAIQKRADLLNMLGYRQNTELKKGY